VRKAEKDSILPRLQESGKVRISHQQFSVSYWLAFTWS